MELFYNFSIFLMNLFINLAAPFSHKAELWVKGRKIQKLPKLIDKQVVWMHCSSLGEFEQGRPVLEMLKQKLPYHIFVLSFFSPSGYERLKKHAGIADHILYLPADLPGRAREFVENINPELCIFVKYEFWLNYIKEIHRKKARLIYISVLLAENNKLFNNYNRSLIAELKKAEKIFTQDDKTYQILQAYGFKNTEVAGDTRIDRVLDIAATEFRDEKTENFIHGEKKVMVCGSTWGKDIELLGKARHFLTERYKIIIAPHEISAKHINKIKAAFNDFEIALHSKTDNDLEKKDILVIDSIGILSRIYRYAQIAYIGGGFGSGIHNTLEPGSYGIPVIFGPRFNGFTEASILVNKNAFFSIATNDELKNVILQLEKTDQYDHVREEIISFFESNRNASEKIINFVLNRG